MAMATDYDAAFSRSLRHLRKQTGLTQRQLAERMTLAGATMYTSTVGKIEAGTRTVPVSEAVQFAAVFGVPLADMVAVQRSPMTEAQARVRVLEFRADEYARRRDEASALLDDALAKLAEARSQLLRLVS